MVVNFFGNAHITVQLLFFEERACGAQAHIGNLKSLTTRAGGEIAVFLCLARYLKELLFGDHVD